MILNLTKAAITALVTGLTLSSGWQPSFAANSDAADPSIGLELSEPIQLQLNNAPWQAAKALDLTVESQDIWVRLQAGFAIPDMGGNSVRSRERALLKNRQALKDILVDARPYLFYILEECERRGLPTELALLPFVESNFDPHAHSRASAAGLWQFIPSTGKSYDLYQNDWVDLRKDVVQSTRAALDYLTYLYDMHGDWHLALISYNWGEGSVLRAIRLADFGNMQPTIDKLDMPAETRAYLPKLQAWKNLIIHADKFGLKLPQMPNQPYFEELTHKRDLDLREIARTANLDLSELRKLNPALKQPVYYAAHSPALLIPVKEADKIRQAIADYKPPKPFRVYRVRRGDTLGHIAERFDVKVKEIQALNSLGRSTQIKPGMTLTLPNPISRDEWPS